MERDKQGARLPPGGISLVKMSDVGRRLNISKRRIRQQGSGQVAHHLIQPILGAVFHTGKLLHPFPTAIAAGGDGFTGKVLFRARDCGLDPEKLLPSVGGLYHESAV